MMNWRSSSMPFMLVSSFYTSIAIPGRQAIDLPMNTLRDTDKVATTTPSIFILSSWS